MENLKLHIEERLWDFIKRSYNSENYSTAILDSIQFLGDTIRVKSGLENDGIQLIGAAFGGENPKIKLNSLVSESEKNFQKGIESMLKGLYSAYRNPRSHSKIEDSELVAFEVITFINHLLKIIDKSSGKFTSDLFMKRVFDEDFVETHKYAELLTKDIPKGKYFEIAIELFKLKENAKIHNLKLVWNCVYTKLAEKQKQELLELVSEELRYTESLGVITRCICLFANTWEQIQEDARLRCENKLLRELPKGTLTKLGKLNQSAIYSSWLTSILKVSLFKWDIAQAIYDLLNSSKESNQRFVLEYFGNYLDFLEESNLFVSFKDVFKEQLSVGNGVIYEYVNNKYTGPDREEFISLLKDFVLVDNTIDDLPF